MRASFTLKPLIRSPLRTLLTFLLVASASFTLFSRAVDYAVTMRETDRAEGFYHGVAALDNSVPDIETETGTYKQAAKPWPTREELEAFAALPGVTLADIRHMTAGRVEGCHRLDDEGSIGKLMLEGVYDGYEEKPDSDYIGLKFKDIRIIASEDAVTINEGMQIGCYAGEKISTGENPYPKSYFDGLETGSRCLLMCTNGQGGNSYVAELGQRGFYERPDEVLCVIDGLGEDYLETEELAYQREWAGLIEQNSHIFDIVYTSDMRAIPRFNEHGMVMTVGRPLTAADAEIKACVVNELFLAENGLSIGDMVSVRLGDFLWPQVALQTKDVSVDKKTEFTDSIELTIVGAYSMADDWAARLSEPAWHYSPSTIFVPASLLPVEVPDSYEVSPGEFSVFIEDAHDISAFRETAEPMVAEMNLALRFSDGGWEGVKDSFGAGTLASFLAAVLYILGAALALFFAAYLYIGRRKRDYASMRMLGVPCRRAGNSIVLPYLVLSAVAMPVGGMAGLFAAQKTAAGAFAGMEGMPEGFVPDVSVPVSVAIACLAFEICFTLAAIWFFLWGMKKCPPLELLYERAFWTGRQRRAAVPALEPDPVPARFELEGFSAGSMPIGRNYGALRHVFGYILRHIRRGAGKTAISLALAVALSAGMGALVLARAAYREACHQIEVDGRATEFPSDMVAELTKSSLVKDVYCYGNFAVHAQGKEDLVSLTVTNDMGRCLAGSGSVRYAKGYDKAIFEGTGQVCLIGQELAEALGVQPGDEVTMLSDGLYAFMGGLYGEDGVTAAAQGAGKMYKVVGIVETSDKSLAEGIFTGLTSNAESIYGQPFPISYCEFTLADNDRLSDLNRLLDGLKDKGVKYSRMASFHINGEALKNTIRTCELLESLFPFAITAAALLGIFGPLSAILQSAQEAASLRILGVTKKRAWCMLALEQIMLCLMGAVLVAAGIALLSPRLFAESLHTLAACLGLYLLGGICGAAAAALQVTGHRVLALLQAKE